VPAFYKPTNAPLVSVVRQGRRTLPDFFAAIGLGQEFWQPL